MVLWRLRGKKKQKDNPRQEDNQREDERERHGSGGIIGSVKVSLKKILKLVGIVKLRFSVSLRRGFKPQCGNLCLSLS